MTDFGRAAVRPLKHYADFRGRSTRTELIAFYLLLLGIEAALAAAAALIGETGRFGTIRGFEIKGIVWLVFLLPSIALVTRRMHDQGRSGWLLLAVASPSLASAVWEFARTGGEFPVHVDVNELHVMAAVVATLSTLAVLVMLFWKDDEGSNRYGPNPRYDEPAVLSAQPP